MATTGFAAEAEGGKMEGKWRFVLGSLGSLGRLLNHGPRSHPSLGRILLTACRSHWISSDGLLVPPAPGAAMQFPFAIAQRGVPEQRHYPFPAPIAPYVPLPPSVSSLARKLASRRLAGIAFGGNRSA